MLLSVFIIKYYPREHVRVASILFTEKCYAFFGSFNLEHINACALANLWEKNLFPKSKILNSIYFFSLYIVEELPKRFLFFTRKNIGKHIFKQKTFWGFEGNRKSSRIIRGNFFLESRKSLSKKFLSTHFKRFIEEYFFLELQILNQHQLFFAQ